MSLISKYIEYFKPQPNFIYKYCQKLTREQAKLIYIDALVNCIARHIEVKSITSIQDEYNLDFIVCIKPDREGLISVELSDIYPDIGNTLIHVPVIASIMAHEFDTELLDTICDVLKIYFPYLEIKHMANGAHVYFNFAWINYYNILPS